MPIPPVAKKVLIVEIAPCGENTDFPPLKGLGLRGIQMNLASHYEADPGTPLPSSHEDAIGGVTFWRAPGGSTPLKAVGLYRVNDGSLALALEPRFMPPRIVESCSPEDFPEADRNKWDKSGGVLILEPMESEKERIAAFCTYFDDWLKNKASKADPGSEAFRDFFTIPSRNFEVQIRDDHDTSNLVSLLLSLSTKNAPLPQWLGLTYWMALPKAQAGQDFDPQESMVVIPFFVTSAHSLPNKTKEMPMKIDGSYVITLDGPTEEFNEYRCQGLDLKNPPGFESLEHFNPRTYWIEAKPSGSALGLTLQPDLPENQDSVLALRDFPDELVRRFLPMRILMAAVKMADFTESVKTEEVAIGRFQWVISAAAAAYADLILFDVADCLDSANVGQGHGLAATLWSEYSGVTVKDFAGGLSTWFTNKTNVAAHSALLECLDLVTSAATVGKAKNLFTTVTKDAEKAKEWLKANGYNTDISRTAAWQKIWADVKDFVQAITEYLSSATGMRLFLAGILGTMPPPGPGLKPLKDAYSIVVDGADPLHPEKPVQEGDPCPYLLAGAGRKLARIVLAQVQNGDHKDVYSKLSEWQDIERRFGFGDIGENKAWPSLLRVSAPPGDIKDWFQDLLRKVQKTAAETMRPRGGPKSVERFVPPRRSEPLVIPVKAAEAPIEEKTAEGFTQLYSGYGLVMRAQRWTDPSADEKEDKADWAILNRLTATPHKLPFSFEIPVIANSEAVGLLDPDGQKQVYLGAPLAGQGVSLEGQVEPFVTYKTPEDARTPRLAIGTRYDVSAFAVDNAGVLPSELQGCRHPSIPALTNSPGIPEKTIRKINYQRQVAIAPPFWGNPESVAGSSTAFPDQPLASFKTPLSKEALIRPLVMDRQRTVIVAEADPKRLFEATDLLRADSGKGTIILENNSNKSAKVVLAEIWASDSCTLRLEFFEYSAEIDSEPALQVDVEWQVPKMNSQDLDIDLTITKADGKSFLEAKAAAGKDPIPVASRGGELQGKDTTIPMWIRVSALSHSGVSALLSLSFGNVVVSASGEIVVGSDGPRHPKTDPSANLMLIAGSEDSLNSKERVWDETYSQIDNDRMPCLFFPVLSVEEVLKWLSNNALAARFAPCVGIKDENPEKIRAEILAFRQFLVLARALARYDTDGNENPQNRLASLLTRLPDPAVESMIVTVRASDRLMGTSGKAPEPQRQVVSRPPGEGNWQEKVEVISKAIESLNDSLTTPDIGSKSGTIEKVRKPLKALVENQILRVYIERGNSENISVLPEPAEKPGLTVGIPPGFVAEISPCAAVRDDLFRAGDLIDGDGKLPSPLDPRLKQLAQGEATLDDKNHLLFRGDPIVVEALPKAGEGHEILPEEHMVTLSLKCDLFPGPRRGFAVAFDPRASAPASNHVGFLAASYLQVREQQFRFDGRPIYHWPSMADDPVEGPEYRVEESSAMLFELEGFAARGTSDAQVHFRTLAPAPAPTPVLTQDLQAPQAAYFRYRAQIRSRYFDAMKPKAKETRGIGVREADKWSRIVVPADGDRVEMSPPSIKVLLPLTRSEGSELLYKGAAPPILAVLNDSPLEAGGIAERIDAEIEVRLDWEREKTGEKFVPDSYLKELGRNPIYDARQPNLSRYQRTAVVLEGPIGNTFDPPDAAAANFFTTSYLIHPELPAASDDNEPPESLANHFLKIRLRRRLDEAWTQHHESSSEKTRGKTESSRIDKSRWLPLPGNGDDGLKLLVVGAAAAKSLELLSVNIAKSRYTFEVPAAVISPEAKDTVSTIQIVSIEAAHRDDLRILWQPLDQGAFNLGVYGSSLLDIFGHPERKSWQLISSFEGSLPKETAISGEFGWTDKSGTAQQAEFPRVQVSRFTPGRWVKTLDDASRVHVLSGPTAVEQRDFQQRSVSSELTLMVKVREDFPYIGFFPGIKSDGDVIQAAQLVPNEWRVPHPIGVQRHLFCVVTEWLPAKESAGVEAYQGLYLVAGKSLLPLHPDPDGSGGNTTRPTADEIKSRCFLGRLAEVEAPARIITNLAGNQQSSPFNQAFFDLEYVRQAADFASQGSASKLSETWVCIRHFGLAEHEMDLSINMTVTGPDPQYQSASFTFQLKGEPEPWPKGRSDIWIRLLHAQNGQSQVQYLVATEGAANWKDYLGKGEPEPAVLTNFLDILRKASFLHVAFDNADPELWAEVSVFMNTKTGAGWDWLFPGDPPPPQSPEDPLQPATTAVEPFARMLSLSPPFISRAEG